MIGHEGKDKKYSLVEREEYFNFLKKVNIYAQDAHVFLVTCNRVEVYYGDGEPLPETVEHLFRVTAGLESHILGETQIQGQVKRAYERAVEKKTTSKGLHILFQKALSVGKKVRSRTSLSKGVISHDKAVISVIKKERGALRGLNAVVLGVNDLNESIVKSLLSSGVHSVFIGSKSSQKAKRSAGNIGCGHFALSERYEKIKEADLLISATSAPHRLVEMKKVNISRELLILDLAVPRDVDPDVGNISGVKLYNIEEVESLMAQDKEERMKDVRIAEDIIAEEIAKYFGKKGSVCV
jgi:glutamyl-tRNA reductase